MGNGVQNEAQGHKILKVQRAPQSVYTRNQGFDAHQNEQFHDDLLGVMVSKPGGRELRRFESKLSQRDPN